MSLRRNCEPAIRKAFAGEKYRQNLLLEIVGLLDHKRQKTRLVKRLQKALHKANKGA